MDQARNDVSILNRKIVIRSIDIGGNDGCKVAAIFFGIRPIHCIDKTLGIGVAFIRGMGRSVVQHGFVNWIGGFIGEDTCGQEAHEFFHFVNTRAFHNIVIDENVFSKKFHLLGHVGKEPSDFGS